MGSINLGNLLMNTHASGVANSTNNKINTRKSTSDTENFKQALNKAKQDNVSNDSKGKTVDTKGSKAQGQNKVAKDNKVEDLDVKEKEGEKEVTAAILNLLSETLQMPIEQITSTLEEMGIEPISLLDESNFSNFLVSLYSEDTTTDLLLGNSQLKEISKLFSKLEEVSSEIMGNEIHQLVQEKVKSTENITINTEAVETEVISEEIVETSSVLKVNDEETSELVEDVNVGSGSQHGTSQLKHQDLGLTVPVEAFESTLNLNNNEQVDSHLNRAQIVNPNPNPNLNIGTQILDHIEITALEQMKEIKMQLSPKELGQLTIKMVEKNGNLVAEIKVESEKTKQFILNELDTLKDGLTKQGIDIGHVQVDVRQNDGTTQMQQQRQKSSKRIQEIIQKHLNEIEAEENKADNIQLNVGESEVDYMV